MTSEVCIMNRLAVVLAADSATTVTQWGDKEREVRYFKGANKIFQLSDHHPVGLMIFDSADILRVPWEIVVKMFRSHLGKKSFNTLQEYAGEFSSFLEASDVLFPSEAQKEYLLEAARSAALLPMVRPDDDSIPLVVRRTENNRIVADRIAVLEPLDFSLNFDQDLLDKVSALWTNDLMQMLEGWRASFDRELPDDLQQMARLGFLEIFKSAAHLSKTGMVIAGFGDHDIFPAFVNFKSYGIIYDRHIIEPDVGIAITHDQPAWLASFAQTAMSDTFSLGLSEDVYRSIMENLNEGLAEVARNAIDAAGGDHNAVPDLDKLIERVRRGVGESILDRARREHAMPLRRVLGSLPVDEMAELAETLINLQSLKERVTKRSETVGGPVDVAIITKHEGLVWVKRKHFFDIGLNSRYMLRQQSRLA